MCGKHDDARLWAYLQLLYEEFSTVPHTEGFNEEIFSRPLASTVRVPTPPPLSPRHSPVSRSMPGPPSPRETVPDSLLSVDGITSPIPLEKVDNALLDISSDAVEMLLDLHSPRASSRSSSSTSSASSSTGDRTPQRGRRFAAFLPPDSRRLSEIQARNPSIATITPHTDPSSSSSSKLPTGTGTGTSRKTSDESSGDDGDVPDPYGVLPESHRRSRKEKSGSSSGGASGSARTPSGLISMTSSRILNEWPDPYGIQGIRTSSRASPTPVANVNSKSRRPSPKVVPPVASDKKEQDGVRPSGGLGSRKASGAGAALVKAMTTAGKGKEEWEVYRRMRVGVLRDWWKTYVDDVRLFLLIGSLSRLGEEEVGTSPCGKC